VTKAAARRPVAAKSAARRPAAAKPLVDDLGQPGPPFERHSPFYVGFLGGAGFLLALFLGRQIEAIGSILVLIVVALFIAAGLTPLVDWLSARGLKRHWSLLTVVAAVIVTLGLFVVAIVPVITDQVAAITRNAPGWLDELQRNATIQKWNDDYDLIDKIKNYVQEGDFAGKAFGGVLGFGLAVLSLLGNAFIVIVLTLYFLASLDKTKAALYELAPASRRDRVRKLGDRVVRSIGGYVSGAFVVALCAGISSLVFLFIAGMGQYAVALAFTVALLDVIPMIGATIGAVIVTAIGFATDPKIGIACVIFYVIYQQLENYVIYPRVMQRSVDVPGSVTVIAALIGAALLGVVGALLAIPTAAAILLLMKEVFVKRQDTR
jgi:predicted PurR-regulated permease PerM